MINSVYIAFSSNDGYAEHLAVAIYSLLKNIKKGISIKIYILDGGISENHKSFIQNIVNNQGNGEVLFIKMNREKYNGWNTKGLSQEAYYRLELPNLLPNINRIIYLDVDLIINKDLSDFYYLNLDGKTIGAIKEITTINYYKDDHNIMSPYGLFFNSGVLLIDLERMRKEKTAEKILMCMKKYNYQLKTHDQEALNIVLLNEWIPLAPKYNALPFLRATNTGKYLGYSSKEFKDAKYNPVIIHFAGEKPWKNNCFHPKAYMYHLYRKECGLSPIKFDHLTIKDKLKQYISKLTLALQTNIPNSIYRYLIYKPYRFIFRIK